MGPAEGGGGILGGSVSEAAAIEGRLRTVIVHCEKCWAQFDTLGARLSLGAKKEE